MSKETERLAAYYGKGLSEEQYNSWVAALRKRVREMQYYNEHKKKMLAYFREYYKTHKSQYKQYNKAKRQREYEKAFLKRKEDNSQI